MTITRELKEEVIRLSNEGKGRNEIARLLTGQISEGSVGNIIRAYRKRSYDTTQKHLGSVNESQVNDMVEQGSLTRVITLHEEKDISIENRIQDFEENGYPLENSQKGPLSWFVDNSETKSEAAIRQTRSSDSPTTVYSSKNKSLPRSAFVKAFTSSSDKSLPQSTAGQQQQQPVANIEDVLEPEELKSVPDRVLPKHRYVQDEIERELRIEGGKAWEYYGAAQTRILNQIAKEKERRRHELFLIDQRRKRLEQMQNDLTVRERELGAYLGLAKKLQEMGLTLEDALPFFETVKQVASEEKLNSKSAAIYVAQELALNRQLKGIRSQLERANYELTTARANYALINEANMQKQHALAVVEDLIKNGVTESQILGLIKFAAEWEATKFQQPNNPGPGNHNGYGHPNGYGGNLSMNDLIRLNLLKSNTTRQLNRMATPSYS